MKIKYTKFQIVLEIVGLLILISMIAFVSIRFGKLPDKIPGHYNVMGEVNRWGNKSEIFITPIITVLLYAFISAITFFPQIWNVPVQITDTNRKPVYQCVRSLILVTKIEIAGTFFFITYFMAYTKPLPVEFLPVMLFILFVTLLFFIVRIIQISKRSY
jgi:uncharacterized membrane protein